VKHRRERLHDLLAPVWSPTSELALVAFARQFRQSFWLRASLVNVPLSRLSLCRLISGAFSSPRAQETGGDLAQQ